MNPGEPKGPPTGETGNSTPLVVVRPTMGLLLPLGGLFAMAIITAVFATVNYVSVEGAFSRLGMETVRLSEVAPDFVVAIVPDLTLSQFSALGLTLGVGVGLFAWFHFFVKLLERAFAAMPRPVRELLFEVRWEIMWCTVLSAFLVFVIRWDLELFLFRSAVDIFINELKDGNIAARLKAFPVLQQEHPDLWALKLIGIGAYGYIGASAVMGLMLEYALHRVGIAWEQLRAVVESIAAARESARDALAEGIRIAPTFPVIGSDPPIAVTRDTALANPGKFIVDPVTGEIYDRTFMDTLQRSAATAH